MKHEDQAGGGEMGIPAGVGRLGATRQGLPGCLSPTAHWVASVACELGKRVLGLTQPWVSTVSPKQQEWGGPGGPITRTATEARVAGKGKRPPPRRIPKSQNGEAAEQGQVSSLHGGAKAGTEKQTKRFFLVKAEGANNISEDMR